MAFVNENIISEEDKALFNSFRFKNPITKEILVPRKWTIDRERDVFLVSLGGQGFNFQEIPKFFKLILGKNVIQIEAYYESKGDRYKPEGLELYWKITSIKIPESIYEKKDKVIELIKESFLVWGVYGRNNFPLKIHFEQVANPQKLLGE